MDEKLQKAEQSNESHKITETQLKSQIQTLISETVSGTDFSLMKWHIYVLVNQYSREMSSLTKLQMTYES